MRTIKLIACTLVMAIMCSLFAGCNKVDTQGHWVMIKKIDANGVEYNAQELNIHGISEEMEIYGNVVQYKSIANGYIKKDCTMYLNDLGDNSYSLNMAGSTSYALAKFEGNELSYICDDVYGRSQMVFVKY